MLHSYEFDTEKVSAPSIATFEPVQENSVRQFLSEQAALNLPSNGHTIESISELSALNRRDDIDKFGIATKILSESAAKYSKSGFRQQLYKKLQSSKKS